MLEIGISGDVLYVAAHTCSVRRGGSGRHTHTRHCASVPWDVPLRRCYSLDSLPASRSLWLLCLLSICIHSELYLPIFYVSLLFFFFKWLFVASGELPGDRRAIPILLLCPFHSQRLRTHIYIVPPCRGRAVLGSYVLPCSLSVIRRAFRRGRTAISSVVRWPKTCGFTTARGINNSLNVTAQRVENSTLFTPDIQRFM